MEDGMKPVLDECRAAERVAELVNAYAEALVCKNEQTRHMLTVDFHRIVLTAFMQDGDWLLFMTSPKAYIESEDRRAKLDELKIQEKTLLVEQLQQRARGAA